ncbi:MAG: alpha/beta hydrolase [Hyphomicrobiaceae bacterium]
MGALWPVAWKGLAALACLYLIVVLGMYLAQRRFLYFPDARHISPAEIGLAGIEEVRLETPDGETLIAWWGPPRKGQKTLLYLHGNAGHLADRDDRVKAYHGVGFGILILAYRGYSGSSGSPSERANVADAGLAHDWLMQHGVAPRDVVLYGESLGSGIAVQLAAAREVGGLILDAPYTSIADLAQASYPLLPARLLLKDSYRSMDFIGRVKAPLLVIHGGRDDIVPVEMGRAVFAAATAAEPKRLVVYPEAGHVYHADFGSRELVRDWVKALP